jgi:hypothetical protein
MRKYFLYTITDYPVFFAQNGFEVGTNFTKGKYNAVVAYENVEKNNKQSVRIVFQPCNSYYKLNKVAPAIYI